MFSIEPKDDGTFDIRHDNQRMNVEVSNRGSWYVYTSGNEFVGIVPEKNLQPILAEM